MAQSLIRARLFGTLTLMRGDEALEISGSTSARALLAYLLLHRSQSHSRLRLAGTFWPEMDETRARRALTQALWRIRNILPEIIEADAQQILIPHTADVWIDVDEFEKHIENHSKNNHTVQNQTQLADSALHRGVELYRGELLEGFYDDWVIDARERLREYFLRALEELIELEKIRGRYPQALDYALKLVQADPFRETAHREVMRLYFALDRPEAALTQYETCCKILENEFGLEADQQTRALAQEIATRIPNAEAPFLPKVVAPVVPWSLDDSHPAQLPLIGRDEDRESIIQFMEDAIQGFGGIVLVEGEAGIGKTRLMTEIGRDAEWRGMQSLWGRNLEGDVSSPYGAILEALSQGLTSLRLNQMSQLIDEIWFRVLLPFMPQLRSELPHLIPAPALIPAQDQQRLVQAFVNVLNAWGNITPLLIVLDDLHWSNEDHIELLIALAPHLQNTRVILIGTYRGEDAQVRSTLWHKLGALERSAVKQRLILKRLSPDASGELIRRSLGIAESVPLFESRLYQETLGNPLFILETLRALSDEGLLSKDTQGNWHTPWDDTTSDYTELPVPQAVERTIATRLERLSPDEQSVLSAAAVLGRDFNFSLLSNTADMEVQQVLSIANTLVRRRFLEETANAYQFSHDKIRQVAYETLPEKERQQLHQRAAECILQLDADLDQHVELLAHHFSEGQIWDQAVIYNQRAGDLSKQLFANSEAALYYSRALVALEKTSGDFDLQSRYDLLLARVEVYALLGERALQKSDLDALDMLVDEATVRKSTLKIEMALYWTEYWEAISDYPKALKSVQDAAHQAKMAGDLASEQKAHLKWGQMFRHHGDITQSRHHLESSYQLGLENQDPIAQAVSLNAIGVLFADNGNYDAAIDYSSRALEIGQSTGDQALLAEIHNNLGGVFHFLADFPRAIENHKQALKLRRAMGDRRFEASSLYNLAIASDDSGAPETARQYLEQVCEISKSINDRRVEGYGWVYLGVVLEELGELKKSREAYNIGLDLRREVGLHAMANDALAGLARVSTAEGKHAEAVGYANQVLTWIEENGREGIGDALFAYAGAYRALLEAEETQRGLAALEDAYTILMQYADNISDPERRRAFLHDISPGRLIWDDYHQYIVGQAMRQIQVRLANADAPLGRPISDDEWIEVTWTVETPQDQEIKSKSTRRQQRILRLMEEAKSAGAAPTVGDLAKALDVSDRTIKRDLANLREAGHAVDTRGST